MLYALAHPTYLRGHGRRAALRMDLAIYREDCQSQVHGPRGICAPDAIQ
jgi:hypothetical protein